jgi:hypothetical protein
MLVLCNYHASAISKHASAISSKEMAVHLLAGLCRETSSPIRNFQNGRSSPTRDTHKCTNTRMSLPSCYDQGTIAGHGACFTADSMFDSEAATSDARLSARSVSVLNPSHL